MRTTLNIADDVFIASKNIARREGKTIGEVLSDFARKVLQNPASTLSVSADAAPTTAPISSKLHNLGLVPYKANNGNMVTNELINALRESESI